MMVMEDTGHALGLRLDTGMEILLHIGIDTVNMKGDGFEVCVKQGDTVKKGDLLVNVDLDKVRKSGYDPIVIMVSTNCDQYPTLQFCPPQHVTANQQNIATY